MEFDRSAFVQAGGLAQTGDTILPFIVGAIVIVALIVIIVAFVKMRRR